MARDRRRNSRPAVASFRSGTAQRVPVTLGKAENLLRRRDGEPAGDVQLRADGDGHGDDRNVREVRNRPRPATRRQSCAKLRATARAASADASPLPTLPSSPGSTCHGAGRARSRNSSRKKLEYEDVLDGLKTKGISIRVASPKLVMEEAPESYKDVTQVVDTCHAAGISRKTVKLRPIAVIKG